MSFRVWVTAITLFLLTVIIFFAWDEIIEAWKLLGRTNLAILLLVIPAQFASYYATGGMIFSYLRSKGNLKDVNQWRMTRIALELNFVNHVLPSGGAAGFSYLGWVLHRHGVGVGRATMSQVVRFVLTFVAFLVALIISLIVLTIDHQVNRTVVLLSLGLAVMVVGTTIFAIYTLHYKKRLIKFAGFLTRRINGIVSFFRRGKKKVIERGVIEKFFEELHQDYIEIRREKKLLKKPFIWSMVALAFDVVLLSIPFLALGYWVNPAVLLIAFGLSSIAGVASFAPGGAGAFEAVMITFLATAGVPPDVAIAGTLLARVTLLLGTIISGYVFYHLTITAYGKHPVKRQ